MSDTTSDASRTTTAQRSQQPSIHLWRLRAAWILYDVASSSYALLIAAVVFPVYFKSTIAMNAPWSDGLWGGLLAGSSICAGLLSPAIGHAADSHGRRSYYLAWVTAVSCAATLALAIPGLGVMPAAALFCTSLISYHLAAGLYDSLLKSTGPDATIVRTSSLGWGLGYAGGLLCFGLALLVTAWNGQPLASREAIIVTGLFYGVFGLVAVLGIRQHEFRKPPVRKDSRTGLLRLTGAYRGWRCIDPTLRHRIIGAGLVSGSAVAIAVFAPLLFVGYFGLNSNDVGLLGSLFSIVSIPSTIFAGFIASRIGDRRLFSGFIPLWLIVTGLLWAGTGWAMGLAAAFFLGLAVGPTQSLARALVCTATPEKSSGAMFGYASLVNRVSSAIGPLFFGVLSSASGDRLLPLVAAASTMILGYILMGRSFRPHA